MIAVGTTENGRTAGSLMARSLQDDAAAEGGTESYSLSLNASHDVRSRRTSGSEASGHRPDVSGGEVLRHHPTPGDPPGTAAGRAKACGPPLDRRRQRAGRSPPPQRDPRRRRPRRPRSARAAGRNRPTRAGGTPATATRPPTRTGSSAPPARPGWTPPASAGPRPVAPRRSRPSAPTDSPGRKHPGASACDRELVDGARLTGGESPGGPGPSSAMLLD